MPTLFKRSNGVFYIAYKENGRRKWQSTGQKNRTKAYEQLLSFNQNPPKGPTRVTLEGFVDDFMEDAKSSYAEGTVTIYESTFRHFVRFLGERYLDTITVRDVDLYRTSRMNAVSPVTVNIEPRMLRAAFFRAERWKLLKENPFRNVRLIRIPLQQPVYLSVEEFQILLSVVRETWLKEIINLAVSTGMRRGEILNLRWKDVDFEKRLIRVHSTDSFRTKSGAIRAIPLNLGAFQLLLKKSNKSDNEYVFFTRGRRIQGSFVTHRFKACVRKAGLNPRLHFHSLRHTFATWLVQEGAPIYEVQKLLGHSSLSVTQIYSHLAPSELHRTVDRLVKRIKFAHQT